MGSGGVGLWRFGLGGKWNVMTQLREEVYFTKGRVIVRGKTVKRGEAKKVDYLLFYKPGIPIAVIEAKDNNQAVGAGMQQALQYAEILDVPFAYSSNGDAFLEHDIKFHQAVAAASDNPILGSLVEMVSKMFYELRRRTRTQTTIDEKVAKLTISPSTAHEPRPAAAMMSERLISPPRPGRRPRRRRVLAERPRAAAPVPAG